jgi:hypothetical protein
MSQVRSLCACIIVSLLLATMSAPSVAQSRSAPAAPKLSAPAAPAPPPTPTPSSAIGAPVPSAPKIAPLSPQIATTPLTGGSARNDLLPTPTSPSESPSQSAQSTAGGGGRTLRDCMSFWDRGTHMTKSEWRAACQRSIHRLDNLKVENHTLGQPKKLER